MPTPIEDYFAQHDNMIRRTVQSIEQEHTRLEEKFGIQQHHADRWLCILGEEYGEACEAANEMSMARNNEQRMFWRRHLRRETMQTAATCIALLMSLELNEAQDQEAFDDQ